MNSNYFRRVIGIFIGLTMAGVVLILLPQILEAAAFQMVLPYVGSAMFAAGLTIFVLESLRLSREETAR